MAWPIMTVKLACSRSLGLSNWLATSVAALPVSVPYHRRSRLVFTMTSPVCQAATNVEGASRAVGDIDPKAREVLAFW